MLQLYSIGVQSQALPGPPLTLGGLSSVPTQLRSPCFRLLVFGVFSLSEEKRFRLTSSGSSGLLTQRWLLKVTPICMGITDPQRTEGLFFPAYFKSSLQYWAFLFFEAPLSHHIQHIKMSLYPTLNKRPLL